MGNLSSDAQLTLVRSRLTDERRRLRPAAGGSPFARLQLFRNPFGELTRSERAELAMVDVRACLQQLEHTRSALQLLGPCGHGKTTHLLAIQLALPASGYVYFPEDGTQPPLPTVRPLLVDEAQRLGWRRRRELLRSRGPIAVSTHVDLAQSLQRAGFHVHTLDLALPLQPIQLQSILNRRIAASALHSDELNSRVLQSCYLRLDQVVALQQRFGSNIRLIEHHLYEVFQRFAEKGEPWPPVS